MSLMREGTPHAEVLNPAQQLAAFQGFLAESAAFTGQQYYALMMRRPFLTAEQFASEWSSLDATVAADVGAGVEHLAWFMNNGLFVMVQQPDGLLVPLEGLKFDIGDPHYSMTIETEEGNMFLPLDDTRTLSIHQYPSPIAKQRPVTIAALPLPTKVLPL
jgi:hypothetical protein